MIGLVCYHFDAAYKKTYVSARTIRVRLVFSIVNLVFPAWPAIRPKREGLQLEWNLSIVKCFLWGSTYRSPLRDDHHARFLHL